MAAVGSNVTVSLVFDNDEMEAFRVLQPVWDLLKYKGMVYHPLFLVVWLNLTHISVVATFTLMDSVLLDFFPWFKRFKINPQEKVTWRKFRLAMLNFIWNNIVYALPIGISGAVFADGPPKPPLAPTLAEFAYGCFFSLLMFDTLYFLLHTLEHRVPLLYKHIHAVHHTWHSPIALTGGYLHPWELVVVAFFQYIAVSTFTNHMLCYLGGATTLIYLADELHSGWQMPLSAYAWLPFIADPSSHDMHHRKPLTNLSPHFYFWDIVLGTVCPGYAPGGEKSAELLEYEKKKKETRELRWQLDMGTEYGNKQDELFTGKKKQT